MMEAARRGLNINGDLRELASAKKQKPDGFRSRLLLAHRHIKR